MIIAGTYTLNYESDWSQLALQEIYLECDTSDAPVTINLFKISDTNRFWNVNIHVSDISNNASVNNITIVSALTDTIDDSTTDNVVINTNGASSIISISNETSWISIESDSGGSTPVVPTFVDVTFAELQTLMTAGTLVKGTQYQITDFQTIYDQPDFDASGNPKVAVVTKTAPIEPIIVEAISLRKISDQAFQPLYPNDKILYDVTFTQTEVMNAPAKGRISERIDNFQNRTDYDHRNILFKRYESVSGSGIYDTYKDTGFANSEFLTFTYEIASNNNFIGNYAMLYVYSGNTFLLSNNVFGSSSEVNVLKISCSNNTFGTFCSNNNLSENTQNNTTGNSFNLNTIGSGFQDNLISDDFAVNTIGDNFSSNVISSGFNNNSIQNDFQGNTISTGFSNNKIANTFSGNTIGFDFIDNTIGNSCTNNFIGDSAYQNTIGNYFEQNGFVGLEENVIADGCSQNDFNSVLYNNKLYSYFSLNSCDNTSQISNNVFHGQVMSNVFSGNTPVSNNTILKDFSSNTLSSTIFTSNNLSEFSDNNLSDSDFSNNSSLFEISQNTFNTAVAMFNNINSTFTDNTISSTFKYYRCVPKKHNYTSSFIIGF